MSTSHSILVHDLDGACPVEELGAALSRLRGEHGPHDLMIVPMATTPSSILTALFHHAI